jgi:hypothetical protein
MNDQQTAVGNLEKIGEAPDRRSTVVHKGQGLGQDHLDTRDASPPKTRLELVFVDGNLKAPTQLLDDLETGIVPGIPVRVSRVAQSDNQPCVRLRHLGRSTHPNTDFPVKPVRRFRTCVSPQGSRKNKFAFLGVEAPAW